MTIWFVEDSSDLAIARLALKNSTPKHARNAKAKADHPA
jgi:hypothetical protein